MSKEESNIIQINKKNFDMSFNSEEVPYLDNEGDLIQDILKEVEKNTEEIEIKINKENSDNICKINFKKND